MKRFAFLVFFICFAFTINLKIVYSQPIKNIGLPFIKNYSPEEYKASEQNWAIYQDDNGIFYFGNTLGVLEFDGITWQLIRLPKRSAIRSICPDETGKIFIGGVDELGYLISDPTGQKIYISIVPLIPKACRIFDDVWEICRFRDKMVFYTHQYLFIFQNGKISVIKAGHRFLSISAIRNDLYVTDDLSNIYKLEGNALLTIPTEGLEGLQHHPVILPYGTNDIMIATRRNGIYIYNGKKFLPWNIKINEFLKKNLLYSAIQIDSNSYALGTWLNGLIIIDNTGKPLQFINKDLGLLSNSVYNLYIDKQKNLWCALDGGISQIEINSPFTYFDTKFGFESPCYAAAVYKNDLYIGGGPYISFRPWTKYEDPFQREPFHKISKTAPEVWQLTEINEKLLGAHSFDIIRIDKDKVDNFPINEKIVWYVQLVKGNPNLMLAGEDDGIYVLTNVNQTWKLRNKLEGYSELGRWLIPDKNNNYWCSTYGDRIYKLRIDSSFYQVTSRSFYDIKLNYPLAISNRLTIIDDKIIVAGEDGFYVYKEKLDRFEPYAEFNNLIVKRKPVNITGLDKNGNVWFTDADGTGELIKLPGDHYKINRLPFYKLDIPSESYPVFTINDSNVIIGRPNEFIHYDPTYVKDYLLPFRTLIRRMQLLHNDTMIYQGGISTIQGSGKNRSKEININYQDNSIRFEFAATSYENIEKNQFQYKLTGYDNNWSNWSANTIKEYTNLPEGQFTFFVRARNVYRVIGTTDKIEFRILPPWYRKIWAYLSYLLISLGLIYLIVYINSYRLKATNIRLEGIIKERTTEISNQKEIIQLNYEQLKDSQGIKDKFYSIISHDLINTIGAIKSFSELLKTYASTLRDEKLNKYSSGLYNSSTSAFELLTNLLNWTRLQTGRMKINPEKINLIQLLNDVLLLYNNLLEKKKLLITNECPLELLIVADKNMISTVLRNLVSNAIKFTPEGGKIFLSVKYTDTEYTFEIKDTGIGMSTDELQKLFRKDIYFQRQGTNYESGTGLGLLLIKNFIELHQGNISVESEPEKGSIFLFSAPLKI